MQERRTGPRQGCPTRSIPRDTCGSREVTSLYPIALPLQAPLAYARLVPTLKPVQQHPDRRPTKTPATNHAATVLSIALGVVAIPFYFFHWSNPMASKHQAPSDHELLATLRNADHMGRRICREDK